VLALLIILKKKGKAGEKEQRGHGPVGGIMKSSIEIGKVANSDDPTEWEICISGRKCFVSPLILQIPRNSLCNGIKSWMNCGIK